MSRKKIAELTMELDCGGKIVTYLPCRGKKDLVKKLSKRYKDQWGDFGHFKVMDEAVVFASYKMHEVH